MYYPILLKLKGKECYIFGGGEIAYRKVISLIECGARVSVYAPEVLPEIEALASQGKIVLEKKTYEPDDLIGANLVIGATNDRDVNASIFRESEERGLWVNVVDDPEICSFILPSVLRRGKLIIAVSTQGVSPAFAKKVRRELEEEFGTEYETFLEAMVVCRKKVKESLSDESQRKDFFTDLVHSDLMDRIRGGLDQSAAVRAIEEKLEKFIAHENR